MSMIAKNRINSTWTPLSNEETKNKIFDERRALVGKWYDKWTDEQRKRLLEDLLSKSKPKQLDYARDVIREKLPATHKDFTRVLPRVISLYIFSFLDPRSLCRCSRACWYWRYLSEVDQLWMPKCLRLGWFLTFTPSPYESGVWKRNYIEHIKSLQVLRPKEPSFGDLDKIHISSKKNKQQSKGKKQALPWRGSDPVPKDTWRFNVLENDDVVDCVSKLRKKKYYGSEAVEVSKSAKSKINTGQNVLNASHRSQSLSRIHAKNYTSSTSPERPSWAQQHHTISVTSMNGFDTAINRPAPVSPPVKTQKLSKTSSRPVTARSARDPPTTELFPPNPWNVMDADDSDDGH